jgi:hypothetical protein
MMKLEDLEGSCRGLIELLSRHYYGGTEGKKPKNIEITGPGRDSNRAPPEYKSRALVYNSLLRETLLCVVI